MTFRSITFSMLVGAVLGACGWYGTETPGGRPSRGGGFVGVHAASTTEYERPFYGGLTYAAPMIIGTYPPILAGQMPMIIRPAVP